MAKVWLLRLGLRACSDTSRQSQNTRAAGRENYVKFLDEVVEDKIKAGICVHC